MHLHKFELRAQAWLDVYWLTNETSLQSLFRGDIGIYGCKVTERLEYRIEAEQ